MVGAVADLPIDATAPASASAPVAVSAPVSASAPVAVSAPVNPTIYIDTKPSVSFSNDHVMFDSENLENNEIYDIPFAEAELRTDDEEIDSLVITNDVLNMEADEIL
jgi:hypothetical protein